MIVVKFIDILTLSVACILVQSYLNYKNQRLDITFPDSSEFSFQTHLEQETQITPQQIGSFKVEHHQAFIKAWIKNKPKLSFDLVWTAREQWIHALSHPPVT